MRAAGQRQLLIPELCAIHPFPVSLWKLAVTLPTTIYRLNHLLLCEQIRVAIAREAAIGAPELPSRALITIHIDYKSFIILYEYVPKNELLNCHIVCIVLEFVCIDFQYEKLEFDFPLLESQTSQLEADVEQATGDDDAQSAPSRSKRNRRRSKNKEDSSSPKSVEEIKALTNPIEQQVNGGVTNGSTGEPTPDPDWQKLEPDTKSNDSYLTGTGVWSGKSADEVQREILEKPAPEVELPAAEASRVKHSSNGRTQKRQMCAGRHRILRRRCSATRPLLAPRRWCAGRGPKRAGGERRRCGRRRGRRRNGAARRLAALSPFTERSREQDSQQPELAFFAEMDLARFPGPNPCRLLHALTMSSANDFFNLERLETMGDSMLKFAVTTHLYAEFAKAHEGKLSQLRSQQVANVNLHRLGVRRALPAAIVSTKFEPTENWLPPGFAVISVADE